MKIIKWMTTHMIKCDALLFCHKFTIEKHMFMLFFNVRRKKWWLGYITCIVRPVCALLHGKNVFVIINLVIMKLNCLDLKLCLTQGDFAFYILRQTVVTMFNSLVHSSWCCIGIMDILIYVFQLDCICVWRETSLSYKW